MPFLITNTETKTIEKGKINVHKSMWNLNGSGFSCFLLFFCQFNERNILPYFYFFSSFRWSDLTNPLKLLGRIDFSFFSFNILNVFAKIIWFSSSAHWFYSISKTFSIHFAFLFRSIYAKSFVLCFYHYWGHSAICIRYLQFHTCQLFSARLIFTLFFLSFRLIFA